jgi:hypothetical protein
MGVMRIEAESAGRLRPVVDMITGEKANVSGERTLDSQRSSSSTRRSTRCSCRQWKRIKWHLCARCTTTRFVANGWRSWRSDGVGFRLTKRGTTWRRGTWGDKDHCAGWGFKG